MKPADNIKELFKNSNISVGLEIDKKILDKATSALPHDAKQTDRNRWSLSMNKKFAKFAAAAIIIAVGLFLHFQDIPFDGATKAYAMSDVPDLFHSAKTLHIKGKIFFPEYDNAEPVEIEHWLDIENARWRSVKPCYTATGEGLVDVYLTEEIFDGQDTKISINHREKTYTYYRISTFQKNLTIQRTIVTLLQLTCGQPEIFDTYQLKGQKVINGQTYNLWEGIADLGPMKFKIQSWLSPNTGQMAKAVIWRSVDGGNWGKQCEFDTVEMNIPIDESIFQLQGPADYVASNNIDAAMDMGSAKLVGGMNTVHLEQHFLFALPDKCLVMCWRNELLENPEKESQYFNDLSLGGPVPQLPAEVYALKTKIEGQEYFWSGKHLMYTQKDGKYYEWALYTPEDSPPTKPQHAYAYTLVYRMNNNDKPNVTLASSPEITIKTQLDFEKLVIEGMRELSDNSELPAPFTLEEVLSLVQPEN